MSGIIINGDARRLPLADNSVQCCVTSPPYFGLRDYGVDGQIGLEQTPDEYVSQLVDVFREVRRVLADDGVLWLNLGDSYAGNGPGGLQPVGATGQRKGCGNDGMQRSTGAVNGLKPKDLIGIPWRVAFALQADGWYLRSDCIWSKPNPMPESVTDRPTKAHEYVFLLTKSARYFYDAEAVAEPVSPDQYAHNLKYAKNYEAYNARAATTGQPGNTNNVGIHARAAKETRNLRTVWNIATTPYTGAHFATMPPELARRCILAGSRAGDVVLDPFNGSGTTGLVALKHGRRYIGVELNRKYIELAHDRTTVTIGLPFAEVQA